MCCSSAVNVYLPKDRVTSQHQGYGFVEFKSEEDADYVRHTARSYTIRDLSLPVSSRVLPILFLHIEMARALRGYTSHAADAGHRMRSTEY